MGTWWCAPGDAVRWALLLTLGCTGYRDCPPEAPAAVEAVTRAWPEVATLLEDTDVICVDADPYPDVPCVYDWYGSPLARGRMTVRRDLAGPCIVHEAMHGRLHVTTGDDCIDHDPACWDAHEIERVTDGI
jgi:hypothetical protein